MVVNVPALETAESSFDDTRETIRQRTGVRISKDQLEDKASEMAADSEPFYGSIDP